MFKFTFTKEMQQILIAGIVVFLIVFGLGFRFISKKSALRVKQYRKELKRVELENEIGKEMESYRKLKESMTVVTEASRFLAEVAKLAGQLNLKLSAISALPVEKQPDYIKLSVAVEMDTTFHELGFFVSKLEGAALNMIVNRLVIVNNATAETVSAPRVMAKMTVTTIALTDTLLEK